MKVTWIKIRAGGFPFEQARIAGWVLRANYDGSWAMYRDNAIHQSGATPGGYDEARPAEHERVPAWRERRQERCERAKFAVLEEFEKVYGPHEKITSAVEARRPS